MEPDNKYSVHCMSCQRSVPTSHQNHCCGGVYGVNNTVQIVGRFETTYGHAPSALAAVG